MYRILSEQDLYEIGYFDFIKDTNSIILVEWSENILNFLPQTYFKVNIKVLGPTKRNIRISREFFNEDIVKIKEMLLDRASKNKKELIPELPFINELKKALEIYCKGKENSIKIVMLKEFASDLDNIINLYRDLPRKHIYTKVKNNV